MEKKKRQENKLQQKTEIERLKKENYRKKPKKEKIDRYAKRKAESKRNTKKYIHFNNVFGPK